MKLNKIYEKYRRQRDGRYQLQVIDLWAEAKTIEDAEELDVSDFSVDLYINKEFVGDISFVLENAGVLSELVYQTDWGLEYKLALAAEKEMKADELLTAKKDNQ